MRFAEPLARAEAPLARRNPVAKLAAALVASLALVATLDPVAPAVTLAVELAVLPLAGVGFGTLLRRTWPLLAAASGIVVVQVLFAAEQTGAVLLVLGPVEVRADPLWVGCGLALRVFAVAIPGILVVAATDPTDLADALVQHLRVPARFAIGALAAFRLLPLLAAEWEMLMFARRARGVTAGRNPVARLRLFVSAMFALLVGAIRRGTRLATAMDARGFDSGLPRTVARPQHFGGADWLLIAAAVATAALALGTSLALGVFRPVVG